MDRMPRWALLPRAFSATMAIPQSQAVVRRGCLIKDTEHERWLSLLVASSA